jgi:hypothetical protein
LLLSSNALAEQVLKEAAPRGGHGKFSAKQLQTITTGRFFTRRSAFTGRAASAAERHWAEIRQQHATFAQLRHHLKPAANITSSPILPANLPGFQLRPTLSTGGVPTSVVTGDFNGDGKIDMVVADGYDNNLWLYPGNGDGSFGTPSIIPLTQGLTPVAIAAADLRGNGKLDLIVADFDSWTISVFLGNGDGTFSYEHSYSTAVPPTSLAVADFNGDGHLDVVAGLSTTATTPDDQFYDLAVFFGDGTGALSQPRLEKLRALGSSPWSLVAGDFNGDGFPDLISTDPGSGARLMLNDGQGNFTDAVTNNLGILVPVTAFFAPASTAVADLNGDGCLDAVTALLGTNNVAVNLGDCTGHFSAPTFYVVGATPQTVVLADVNGDGIPDAITTSIAGAFPNSGDNPSGLSNDSPNLLSVAFGDGKGGFLPPHIYRHLGPSQGLAAADLNRDGRADAIAVNPVYDSATVFVADANGSYGDPQGVYFWSPDNSLSLEGTTYGAPSFLDLNGDGSRDILIPELTGNGFALVSLLNDGAGHFGSPTIDYTGIPYSQETADYRAADFRNNGKPDVVATGAYSPFLAFIPNNGDGTFGAAVITDLPNATGPMAVGDFNGDGIPDIATSNQVFLGNGDGTFRPGATLDYSGNSFIVALIRVADINHDGKLDIVMNDRSGDVWSFEGNGDGTFQPLQAQISQLDPNNSQQLVDINNDGIPDFMSYGVPLVTSFSPSALAAANVLYTSLGQAGGIFGAITSSLSGYTEVPANIGEGMGPLDIYSTDAALGPGKLPDVLAFQYVPEPGATAPGPILSFAQVMSNNGDGTFTSTNDLFDLSGAGLPQYAADLNGDGKSDLVEVDGGNLSLNVMNGTAAPLFQIGLAPDQYSGTSGNGWIYLNSPTAGGTVALSSSTPGITVPSSVTISPGQSAAEFTIDFGSSFNPLSAFDVTAQMGGQSETVYGSHAYSAGFTMQVSGNMQQVINEGQSTQPVTLTLTSINGYSSTVNFSCPQVEVAVQCSFSPASVTVPANGSVTTTLSISSTDSGYFQSNILVAASDGIYAQYASFNLQIDVLSVSVLVAPAALSPDTVYYTLMLGGVPPVSVSCSGLPAGVSCSLPGLNTMEVQIPNGIPVGSYPFTITASSDGATTSTTSKLVIQDFSILPPDAADDWAPPGGDASRSVSLQSIGGFSGDLLISCTTSWGGACTGFGGQVLTNAVLGSASFEVAVPAGTPTGSGSVTIVASPTENTTVRSATFPFEIASVSGSISPAQLNIKAGATGTATLSLTSSKGFDGSVALSCDAPTAVYCTLSNSSISLNNQAPSAAIGIQLESTTVAYAPSSSSHRPSAWLAVAGLPFLFFFRRKRGRWGVFICLGLLSVMMTLSSCGGSSAGGSGNSGGGGGSTPVSQTYQVHVTGKIAQTDVSVDFGTITVNVD